MEKMNGEGLDLKLMNIEKLKTIFPECVNDGKVDFETLKGLLGEHLAKDNDYSFNWVGKSDAIKFSLTPSRATLIPCKEKSVNWDKTENLFIEGDNFEVLKILSKTYHGKIRMIFIDPPYNTGHNFVYKDNYTQSIENYLKQTKQANRTNPEISGRYHTDWLNMIYPRIKLAREMLSDDGAIFVSIDYNEFANLKKIMDEIFGENNFQREIIWRIGWLSGYKTTAPNFIRNHDTILFYSKNSANLDFTKKYIENKDFKEIVKKEPKIKAKLESFGLTSYQQDDLLNFINHENRPERYPIEDTWNCNEYDDLNSIAIVSFSGEKISKILEIDQDFKGQKSIKMLQRLIEALTRDGDIIMDFFAGTGSTAHAVMQQNAIDKTKRKFIMVQLPEMCEEESAAKKAGYETICDISEERLRRCGKKINDTINSSQLNLFSNYEDSFSFDLGFKVFKLASTCIKPWDPTAKYDENNIFDSQTVIKEDRTDLDVAYEVMLKYGVFNMPLEEITVNGKTVYSVGSGYMIISLNDEVTTEDVAEIAKLQPKAVVFKEKGFKDDNAKINADYTFKRLGIDNVKCI